jgi:serine/threonine protein kinase
VGAGGAGVVYEAFDREQGARVALKTLQTLTPDSLLRFKNEFRQLAELAHPNLVTLGELFEDCGRWFFTMEFVQGVDFHRFVRDRGEGAIGEDEPTVVTGSQSHTSDTADERLLPFPGIATLPAPQARPGGRPGFDERRLRLALGQLFEALITLHRAGKIHRDVKPSNILITADERLVLLDFGLVMDVDAGDRISRVDQIVGTADYMAPEQAAARPIGPQADWYAAGVVLYRALTGKLPFTGTSLEVLVAKQRVPPLPAATVAPGVPEDLDALCSALLAIDPAARPSGDDVLARLGVVPGRESGGATPIRTAGGPPLVGRKRELALLEQALFDTRSGSAVTVFVRGESGLGKSALVRRFAERMAAQKRAVVLSGRCYERESVPYKSVDGVIDALTDMLLSVAEPDRYLPRNAALLPQVFPVLRRVQEIADAPLPPQRIADPREQRLRVFAAIRDLLARIAERHPLIVAIDDLQWTDADSMVLLREVLRPPDPPALLLIATVRSGSEPPGSTGSPEALALPGDVRHLELEPLSPPHARRLARLLMGPCATSRLADTRAIAQEAAGHPLLIDELVRHALASGGAPGHLQLKDALGARINRLDRASRNVLELLAVARAPLCGEVVAQATMLEFADLTRRIRLLAAPNLVRSAGVRRTDPVELYHDRIRQSILSQLSMADQASWHGRLALALESAGGTDPEALAMHWEGAGNRERAARYALAAADRAAAKLAFDNAAELYRRVLALAPIEGTEPRSVKVRLADALTKAGRCAEAGQMYLESADGAPLVEALDLERRAAGQFLMSGRVAHGLATLESVLRRTGMRMPGSPGRALVGFLVERARLALRGLHFVPRDTLAIDARQLVDVDICWAAATGLGLVNVIAGALFQSRLLRLALRAGEARRIGLALGLEIGYAASMGVRARPRIERLLLRARALGERLGDPYIQAWTAAAATVAAFLLGRFQASQRLGEEADTIFRERCVQAASEYDNIRIFRLAALVYLGELVALRDPLARHLEEAESRGDVYTLVHLSSGVQTLPILAQDDPVRAEKMAVDTVSRWSRGAVHLVHFMELQSLVAVDLYRGDGPGAYARVRSRWGALRKALLLSTQYVRTNMLDLRARAALATASARPDGRGTLAARAERDARRLGRQGTGWARALGKVVTAGAAGVQGPPERALALLLEAEQALAAEQLALHELAVRRRRGALLAGDEGRALVAEADAGLRARGVVAPARLAALLVPGFSD